jgi:DNA modification methylase
VNEVGGVGMKQLDLFDDVLQAYVSARSLSNASLYSELTKRRGIPVEAWTRRQPIGRAQALHSPLKRCLRWHQQTLRALGLLERESRGVWRLTPKGEKHLSPAPAGAVLLGFSTHLGVALWARAESVFPRLDEPIALVFSSLPYPLAVPRAYGGPREQEYVDWTCTLLEPLITHLVQGGSLALNLGTDVFLPGSPARSMYVERLMIALHDRFGLSEMDSLVWSVPNRPPGPIAWASKSRQQLNAGYETVLWMTNDPLRVRSDNRRVLQPHTAGHLRLMAAGGERRERSYGDGAHRIRHGAYGRATPGRIPKNVITMGHRCTHKRDLVALAGAAGLPVHGATMPLALAKLIIEFLTERQDLVADPCAGWLTTGKACEETGRRYILTEQMGEYVLGGAMGFRNAPGFRSFGRVAG